MEQSQNTRLTLRIHEELGSMDAIDFERFSHALLEKAEGFPLIYRGSTMKGAASGYTVDSYSSNAKIVGEYGTKHRYFSKPFDKPLDDVKHALSLLPSLEKLYLLSNQDATNTEMLELTKAINDHVSKVGRNHIEIQIFDARKIAEHLVSILKDIDYSDPFLTHFSALEKYLDEFSMTNMLPMIRKEYVRRGEEEEALEQLERNQLLYVHGISGIGKTEFAISIANQLRVKEIFEVIVWIDGKQIDSLHSLTSINIERVQQRQNVAGLLKRRKILLIIDNLDRDIHKILSFLSEINQNNSKIIITSQRDEQVKDRMEKMNLSFLNDSTALQILNFELVTHCPQSIYKDIKQVIGGHPLLLTLTNRWVVTDKISWKEVSREASELPKFADDNGKVFFKRLLEKHSEAIATELSVLLWLGGQVFNRSLLQRLISSMSVMDLLKRGFLINYENFTLRMHDLIFNSIKMEKLPQVSSEIENKFIAFFLEAQHIKDYQFYNALYIHRNFLIQVISKSPDRFDLIPTYLMFENIQTNEIKEIMSRTNIDNLLLCQTLIKEHQPRITAYLECAELMHRNYKQSGDREAEPFANQVINNLKTLVDNSRSCLDLHYEIKHHLGKFYTFIKADALARACFEEVIDNTDDAYHSKLQLAKLASVVEIEQAKLYLEDIFITFKKAPSSISISIVLAAFNEFKKSVFSDLREKYLMQGELFETAIQYSAVWGYYQPFKVLTEVGKTITYRQPERYIELVKLLPEEPKDRKSETELFYLGQVYKELGKCYKKQSEEYLSALLLAKTYFQGISSTNGYYCTMIAECYILIEEYDQALEILNIAAPNNRGIHWLYRYSQALYGKNQFDEALCIIEQAISGIREEKYQATFLRQQAQILYGLGLKIEAKTAYENAIHHSDPILADDIKVEMTGLPFDN